MSVLIEVSPNTFEETGLMEHISRLKICYWNIAYTIKRKHKCSSLLMKLGEFLSKDCIAMLFLLTAFALESKCKDTKKKDISNIIFVISTKKGTM